MTHATKPFIIGSATRTKSGAIPNGQVGLGLALCKLVIKAHNGMISAKSDNKNGAVFKFTLPITQKLRLHSGSHVELDMINQRIVITKSNLELDLLLDRIDSTNFHHENFTDDSNVGNESCQIKQYPFEIEVNINGKNGAVLCNQVRSLDWQERKATKITTLSNELLEIAISKLSLLISC
ncbi:unnamed protein product [Rotaria magnacalcarata]|uniref:Histidine kinase/HSP90-like ATPase domain-containing protein n=1 Tax=Rotaria magnacalcarata TaxID=392030 RepID=A0A819RZK5_9BILA|nr:unnamed protein product [Rotaria magnacalcarata]